MHGSRPKARPASVRAAETLAILSAAIAMIGTGSNNASMEWMTFAAGTLSGVHIHLGAKPMKWSGTQIALAPHHRANRTPDVETHNGYRQPS